MAAKTRQEMKGLMLQWQNKRKAIALIIEFSKYPTQYPSIRYHHLRVYLEKLWTSEELTKKHFYFLVRVLEIEYMGIKNRLKALEGAPLDE